MKLKLEIQKNGFTGAYDLAIFAGDDQAQAWLNAREESGPVSFRLITGPTLGRVLGVGARAMAGAFGEETAATVVEISTGAFSSVYDNCSDESIIEAETNG